MEVVDLIMDFVLPQIPACVLMDTVDPLVIHVCIQIFGGDVYHTLLGHFAKKNVVQPKFNPGPGLVALGNFPVPKSAV